MKKQDSPIPEDWKRIARKDWQRAKRDLDLGDIGDLCERVSGYYLLGRYPLFLPSHLTAEDIEDVR